MESDYEGKTGNYEGATSPVRAHNEGKGYSRQSLTS